MNTKALPPETFEDHLRDLLQHHLYGPPLDPALSVAQNGHGTWSVVLTLDGFYSSADSANNVLPLWRDSLRRVLEGMEP